MSLSAGTRLGPYEILSAIGAGGQSEVYRARDTQRGIEVVLRCLPETVAVKPDAVERIERDSRLLETLNHPNIGGLPAVRMTSISSQSVAVQRMVGAGGMANLLHKKMG